MIAFVIILVNLRNKAISLTTNSLFMKTVFIIYSLLLGIHFSAFAQHAIGHTTITFQDPARNNRAIETEIYYPAQAAGTDATALTDSFPVLVFGHGFVMAWSAYQNIWEALVPRGYILAFPRTEGNIFSTNHQAFGWDLEFLVSEMQTEGNSSGSILFGAVGESTALMGHSMGGGAAFLAAEALCLNGNTNLKTLVGLAPAESTTNGVSSIGSATNVSIPSLIFSGSQDGVTPPADHHIPMYDSLGSTCKLFINVLGGAHCYFANANFNCDFGEGSASSGISISRLEQQAVTMDFLNLWLDYNLKGICEAHSILDDSLSTSARITSMQSCTPNFLIDTSISVNGMVLTSNALGVDYQWLDCTNNYATIPNANSAIFTGVLSNTYAVELTHNNCKDTSTCIPLGVLDASRINSEAIFKLSPNPVQEVCTIAASQEITGIRISTLMGQVVYTNSEINQHSFTISTKQWEAGLYLVELESNGFRKVIKLIKD